MEKDELSKVLKSFYANARQANGQFYKKNSMIGHRHGLARYFKTTHKIDIIDDPAFHEANTTFKASMIELKKKGFAKVEHFPEINADDILTIYGSFDINHPRGLLNKVLFDIIFYLCRRGRENLADMTKSTFIVETDRSGRKYVIQDVDEMLKNHRENDDNDAESAGAGGRMYDVPGKSACFQNTDILI